MFKIHGILILPLTSASQVRRKLCAQKFIFSLLKPIYIFKFKIATSVNSGVLCIQASTICTLHKNKSHCCKNSFMPSSRFSFSSCLKKKNLIFVHYTLCHRLLWFECDVVDSLNLIKKPCI